MSDRQLRLMSRIYDAVEVSPVPSAAVPDSPSIWLKAVNARGDRDYATKAELIQAARKLADAGIVLPPCLTALIAQ